MTAYDGVIKNFVEDVTLASLCNCIRHNPVSSHRLPLLLDILRHQPIKADDLSAPGYSLLSLAPICTCKVTLHNKDQVPPGLADKNIQYYCIVYVKDEP